MSNRKRLPRPWRAARTPDEWLDALWESPAVPHDAKIVASIMARHARRDPSTGHYLVSDTAELRHEAASAIAAFGGGDAA